MSPVNAHALHVPNGSSIQHLKLDNVAIVGTVSADQTESEVGLWVDGTASIDDMTVVDSKFNDLAYGWYFQKTDMTAGGSNVTNVNVSGSPRFNKTRPRASTSRSSRVRPSPVRRSSTTASTPASSTLRLMRADINLKGNTSYTSLIFNNMTVTGNAIGAANARASMSKLAAPVHWIRLTRRIQPPSPTCSSMVELTPATRTASASASRARPTLARPASSSTAPTSATTRSPACCWSAARPPFRMRPSPTTPAPASPPTPSAPARRQFPQGQGSEHRPAWQSRRHPRAERRDRRRRLGQYA